MRELNKVYSQSSIQRVEGNARSYKVEISQCYRMLVDLEASVHILRVCAAAHMISNRTLSALTSLHFSFSSNTLQTAFKDLLTYHRYIIQHTFMQRHCLNSTGLCPLFKAFREGSLSELEMHSTCSEFTKFTSLNLTTLR